MSNDWNGKEITCNNQVALERRGVFDRFERKYFRSRHLGRTVINGDTSALVENNEAAEVVFGFFLFHTKLVAKQFRSGPTCTRRKTF